MLESPYFIAFVGIYRMPATMEMRSIFEVRLANKMKKPLQVLHSKRVCDTRMIHLMHHSLSCGQFIQEYEYFEKMLDLAYENESLKRSNEEMKSENRTLKA